ncbi:DUF2589 domain-containing protein [Dolichospermum sp. FACHB-1091]|uniref:DUF2589 domain-containing protein n=1 Tax=Dolichospermum sp. FACHB-1091 TaxID=2692798 RepID=UPI001680F92D|nr:DUF2589 domain-containing protein [Dolichospermum sp. FACHB-1091]MBD2443091.1 DUF2589 domain-containing protein [Dolichospermum sp. FACHB-1091]
MAIDTTPSTTATSALQGIPFSSLIGGPLSAAIDAQVKAAGATVDFIQNVGLTGPADQRRPIQVEFVYYVDGKEAKLMVPLLTIVPIPYLAIDEVDIQFKANIKAEASTYQEDNSSSETSVGNKTSASFGGWFVKGSTEFNASYSSKKDSKATQESKYSVEYTMDLKIHAGQDDMPAGLAKVLNILEGSITPTSTKPSIQVSPDVIVIKSGAQDETVDITATLFDDKGLRVVGKDINITFVNGSETRLSRPSASKTDENGTVEFTLKYTPTSNNQKEIDAAKIKCKVECADPQASKTITVVIPAQPASAAPAAAPAAPAAPGS